MSGSDLLQRRYLIFTDLRGIRTAVIKVAAVTGKTEIRRCSGDRLQIFFRGAAEFRHGVQKTPGVRVKRLLIKSLCVRIFYGISCIHDHDGVTHLPDNAEVVGDEQDRGIELLLEVL